MRVEGLRAEFRIRAECYPAIDGVSFPLDRNETLALVGESGFGKSVTAFTIMGLVPQPQGRVSAGCILLDGVDLRTLDEARFEALRGDRMTMVFQKPMTSLNPVMSVGRDCRALRIYRRLSRADSEAKALVTLEEVKISSAKTEAWIAVTIEHFGRLDGLITAVGIDPKLAHVGCRDVGCRKIFLDLSVHTSCTRRPLTH